MKLEIESNIAAAPSFAAVNYAAEVETATENDIARLLQGGVKAAQEGNRIEARVLLLQVAEVAPNNENAWLWLASISDYPEELLVSLNNVLKINPNNARALEWAYATKSLLAKNFVQRGVDASNEAQMDLARQYFLQAVVHDDRNEMAWFWLASISDSAEEKLSHLQKVLTINPENETALTALQMAKSQITESLLRRANTAAIAGERESANEMLQIILKQTPELEAAWILKSYLADSFSDKVVCFEKVLSINSKNDAAISGLASLREMMAQTENKKSQNLAVIAAFLAAPPEENPTPEETPFEEVQLEENQSQETVSSTDETIEPLMVSSTEIIEDAQVVAEQPVFEEWSAQEVEFSAAAADLVPVADDTATDFYQPEVIKDFRESEATAESDYRKAAETPLTAEMPVEPEAQTEPEAFAQPEFEPEIIEPTATAEAEFADDFESAPHDYSEYSNYSEPEVHAPIENLEPQPEVYTPLNTTEINLEFDTTAAPADFDYSLDVEAEEPREAMPAVKKIMVVDDSATVRKLIAQKLEMSGYEVICLTGGSEALEMIKEITPDLILLDTAMPKMDGYQVCQSIRGNEATKDVPIVMISGKDGFFDKVRGQMSGSTGYIAKPFGPETLMKTVESYIQ